MSAARATTPARTKDDTVAEEPRVEERQESTSEKQQATAPEQDMCDNHPDRPAVMVTSFPWSGAQHLCAQCVPPQYRAFQ